MTMSISSSTYNSALGPLPTDPQARLKKVAGAMEAVTLKQILSEARPKSTTDNSFANTTFQGMMDDTLAQKMAERGVFGLATTLNKQLTPRLGKNPVTDAQHTDKAELQLHMANAALHTLHMPKPELHMPNAALHALHMPNAPLHMPKMEGQ